MHASRIVAQLNELVIPAGDDTVRQCSSFEVATSLQDFVGRSLTLHAGSGCVCLPALR